MQQKIAINGGIAFLSFAFLLIHRHLTGQRQRPTALHTLVGCREQIRQ